MQEHSEPHSPTVNAITNAAEERSGKKCGGNVPEGLLGKIKTLGHMQIKHRAPYRVEAP